MNLKLPLFCLAQNKVGVFFRKLYFNVYTYIFISHSITFSGLTLRENLNIWNLNSLALQNIFLYTYILAHLLNCNIFISLFLTDSWTHWPALSLCGWQWDAMNNRYLAHLECPWRAPAVFKNDLSDPGLRHPIAMIIFLITEENCVKATSSLLDPNSQNCIAEIQSPK